MWADRNIKLKRVAHAETAAILDAARAGEPTLNATMYGCWVACFECAKNIVEAGVRELVGHHHAAMDERPEWQQSSRKLCISARASRLRPHRRRAYREQNPLRRQNCRSLIIAGVAHHAYDAITAKMTKITLH